MKPLRLIPLLSCLTATAPAGSTIESGASFVWSANGGWINFRPDQPAAPEGVTVDEYHLSGFAWSANFGWINFGDGTPQDGIRYSNTSAADCGVNHDGAGNLTGWAWGANIGWINFGWAAAGDSRRPRFNLLTGVFSGFAWSANTGWINPGSGNLVTATIVCTDGDGDGIADAWEREHFGNLSTAAANTDSDDDGTGDAAEYIAGADPLNAASNLRLLSKVHADAFEKVTLTFSGTSPARVYHIEISTDLVTFTDSGLGAFLANPGGITAKAFTGPANTPRVFYCVRVSKPLP